MLDTIIFDMDDTLYDQAATFRNTCKIMLDVPLTNREMNNLYLISRKHSDALFDDQVAGKMTLEEMHIRRIKDACAEIGIKITADQALAFQNTYAEKQSKIQLFDEIIDLLDYLTAQKKQLAVLTNGTEGHQAMKINQLNLGKWIPEENLFISGEMGHAKPSEVAFRFIEDKLNLSRENTVYVGDSFANDVIGAKRVGWKAIWMNHRRREMPKAVVQPDSTVHSAKELLDLFLHLKK